MYPRHPHGPGYPPYQPPPGPGGYGAGMPYPGAQPYMPGPGGYPVRPSGVGVRPPRPQYSAPPQRRPGTKPQKATTLWVGKIAASVEDELILGLLEACGAVKEWKPATDPETGKMKGFGFCTYQEPEGVILALRLLNGLSVDGQGLALKCNKATEEYIAWYEGDKNAKTEGDGAGEGNEQNGGSDDALNENQAFEKIMSLVGDRVAKNPETNAGTAAGEFLSNLNVQAANVVPATAIGGAPPGEKSIVDKAGSAKREREVDKEVERELQRQRREEQRRIDQEARAIRDATRLWEAHERERQREVERDLDRERDLLRERARQLRVDNEVADSDDDEEPWKRRPYRQSRRAADRRRRRELELKEDAADKQKELEEVQAQARAAEALHEVFSHTSPLSQKAATTPDTAVKEEEKESAKAIPEVGGHPAPVVVDGPAAARRKPTKAVAAFDEEEEEEDKPKRTLIPIKYTEEELRGLHEEPGSLYEQAPQQPSQALDPAQLKRQLMAKVPKDRADVFAYAVKWDTLRNAPGDVKERISGWVSKKIKDLLGMEEPSFCEFIMSQVASSTPAEEMLQALQDVLDEDADSFVTKLFQVLIYETEKLAQMIS